MGLMTTLLKVLPFSIAVAMLSTLIYMTFSPIYYLSASFPAGVFVESNFQSISVPNAENSFFSTRINKLKKHQVIRLISMVDAEFPTTNKEATQLQQELDELLRERLQYLESGDEIQINLHVKKHAGWKKEYRAFLASGATFNKTFDKSRIEENISWKTKYWDSLFAFVVALIAAAGLAIWLSHLKRSDENSHLSASAQH